MIPAGHGGSSCRHSGGGSEPTVVPRFAELVTGSRSSVALTWRSSRCPVQWLGLVPPSYSARSRSCPTGTPAASHDEDEQRPAPRPPADLSSTGGYAPGPPTIWGSPGAPGGRRAAQTPPTTPNHCGRSGCAAGHPWPGRTSLLSRDSLQQAGGRDRAGRGSALRSRSAASPDR